MSYATVAQFREYMSQIPAGAAYDAQIQDTLDRAERIIDGRLGFSYAAYGAGATRDVRMAGDSEYLDLPAHQQGSIAAVAALSGRGTTGESTAVITDFVQEDDGRLWRGAGWTRGAWYRVTAAWGYGPAPASIIEVELEIAINLWRGRDSGQFSDVVGVEGGGAVGYQRALTNRQRQIIADERTRAGVWGIA